MKQQCQCCGELVDELDIKDDICGNCTQILMADLDAEIAMAKADAEREALERYQLDE